MSVKHTLFAPIALVFGLFFVTCSDNGVGPGGGGGTTATTYTLTVNGSPTDGGTVSPSGTSIHSAGTNISITATAAPGYSFLNWTGAGVANPNSASTNVSMTANRTITANFQPWHTLTVRVSPEGAGTVGRNPNQTSYAPGTRVTLTATPAVGYALTSWTGGVTNLTGNSATVVMDANRTITANFNQMANAVIITLTRVEMPLAVKDLLSDYDPLVHFVVAAWQGSSRLSSNQTGYLLDATDIPRVWTGSRRSEAITFTSDVNNSELRISPIVVEQNVLANEDVSPGSWVYNLPLPVGHTGSTTLSSSGRATVGFSYEFVRR